MEHILASIEKLALEGPLPTGHYKNVQRGPFLYTIPRTCFECNPSMVKVRPRPGTITSAQDHIDIARELRERKRSWRNHPLMH